MSAKYYGGAAGTTLPMTTGFDQRRGGQSIFYSGFGFANWHNDVINDPLQVCQDVCGRWMRSGAGF